MLFNCVVFLQKRGIDSIYKRLCFRTLIFQLVLPALGFCFVFRFQLVKGLLAFAASTRTTRCCFSCAEDSRAILAISASY